MPEIVPKGQVDDSSERRRTKREALEQALQPKQLGAMDLQLVMEHFDQLVLHGLVTDIALHGATKKELTDCGISLGAAAVLKEFFPSPPESTPVLAAIQDSITSLHRKVDAANQEQLEQQSVQMSQVPAHVTERLRMSFGLLTHIMCQPQWTDRIKRVQYTPFDWQGRSEEGAAPDLVQHFTQELRKYGVPMSRNGFKIGDVRALKTLLSFRAPGATVSGTTDALLIPYGVSLLTSATQARVSIDWKTEEAIREEAPVIIRQVFAELCGTLIRSAHPAVAVATDAVSKMLIMYVDDNTVYICQNLDEEGELQDITDGMRMLAGYIIQHCSPHGTYAPPARPSIMERLRKRVNGQQPRQEQLTAMHRIKQAAITRADAVAEQLEVVQFLPEAEQWEATLSILSAWAD
mmetsp:Transcript_8810/g.18847  ORF Transcript_8810/g.18847 Transcript_8810/m.18847 type:complete len:406 (-) Transcript_8810:479-1696(-)|eukprot:CAMPEP_0202909452 /NCGR_PEP_ID=MMETSP1392-20130828/49370_1 /ASSEMBLY_ACC=CAM_ASM_000868 /TAXON_ID=225041 /ORGANISM="Chlamydomonas chlamydogama, Strain SAG 11-48b" /LENGTH=405 /DNA_ID=CAMNT_0049599205 /DNA_START=157 /DNA_END=1374 /DNA_ORIENTATION=+